ncbi:hypothetical protein [Micromonospora sp. NPDC005220]|uniref:hypothetical protein n=1 Tax=Micromonospora sp. NPDC005220 TaxID=3155589 RepID=UPI0033A10517
MAARWFLGTSLFGFCVAVLLEVGFPETIFAGGFVSWLAVRGGATLLVRLLAHRLAKRVLRVDPPSAGSACRENKLAHLSLAIDAKKRSIVVAATYVTNSK